MASSSTSASRAKLSSTEPGFIAASRGALIRWRVTGSSGTCSVTKSARFRSSSMLCALCTLDGNRHAASTVISGSKPTTFIPSLSAISATRLPMAPRPMIPSVRCGSSNPGERFLAVLDLSIEVARAGVEPGDEVERGHEVARREEQRRQHELLHRVGVGARCVEHRHPAPRHLGHGNVVRARPGAADRPDAGRDRHRVHVVRADEDGVRQRSTALPTSVAPLGKPREALARDVIEGEDLEGGRHQPYICSNCFM